MITTVGTWATRSALQDPAASVAGFTRAGVNLVSLMLNDYRVSETPAPFWMHPPEQVIALADACRAAGIEFGVTSWIMPDRAFIEGAAAQLIPLLEATGSTLLMWDAEEVWVRGDGDMTHDAAASLVGDLFSGVTMGVTGIAYANTAALRGLSRVCLTWSPQCYATTNAGSSDPLDCVALGVAKWRAKFGEPERWIIGLAAYAQPATPADYMQPCVDQVIAASLDAICYWSHGAIAKRPDVTEFVSSVGTLALETGSIMPVLDIAAMPSGTRSEGVGMVQGLLVWAGFDPGVVDGKPGTNTLNAVVAFQAMTPRCTADGVVDGATWWALLRC